MKIKFCSLFAGAALLALAGAANAQPRALSEHQMDGLTAGAASTANAGGFAIGDFLTFTTTQTATNAVTSIANQTPAQIGIAFGGIGAVPSSCCYSCGLVCDTAISGVRVAQGGTYSLSVTISEKVDT
jgi:hypothetical protein